MSESKQTKITNKPAPKKAPEKKEVGIKEDPREIQRKRIEAERKRESRMVRGKFTFIEVPGGRTVFPWRAYPGEKIKHYTLVDGEIYTIPIGLAKHLNSNCKYPVYEHEMSPSQSAVKQELGHPVKIKKYVHRYSFQSLDFLEAKDGAAMGPVPDIVEVEHR